MTDTRITYHDEDTDLVFVWHGGAYIDVGTVDTDGRLPEGLYGDSFHAFDVINVWDDEADRSYPEMFAEGSARPFRRILEEFEARCRQYVKESAEQNA